jgi:polysaccharide chain length determinant protein (PEP-CTERM system associated)
VSRVDAGRAAVAKLQLTVEDAKARRDALAHELAAVPQFLSVDAAGPQVIIAGKPLGLHAQLEDARTRLDDLKARFTDEHPDVIALRQQIADLQARAAKEGTSPSTTSGDKSKSNIANPVYSQIKIQLVEAETALASQERALSEAQAEQVSLEKKARETPGVEAQAQDMDRDYNIKKKAYDELLQRREQTRIADAANTKADKIQFRIVDAPQVPVVPVAPNQPLLLLGIFVVAVGTAIGVPLALLQFDKSFATVANLRVLGLPVLGSVSRFSFPGARKRQRIQMATFCASTSALVMVLGTLLIISVRIYGLGIS